MQVELSIDTESRGKARLQNKAFALAWREELPSWWRERVCVSEVPPQSDGLVACLLTVTGLIRTRMHNPACQVK